MKKQAISLLLVLVLLVAAVAVTIQATDGLPAGGAYMVAADGTQTVAEDPASAWATGSYAYVKLYGDTQSFADLGGKTLWVDLNGNNLTVGGEGTLYAFDSANDEYDATACGKLTLSGAVQLMTDVTAPDSGNRYIAVKEGSTATCHRLDIALSAVTLRTSAAGLYYKAVYNCDETLTAQVSQYGVVLSLHNMPGADFLKSSEAEDVNRYTVATEPFKSGVVATSGSVFGIMKSGKDAQTNEAHGQMKIYANPYIRLDSGLIVVADEVNAGKTAADADFTGIAYSLYDTLEALDETFYTYTKADRANVNQFKWDWEEKGMPWTFAEIGKRPVDNSNLSFEPGTTRAMCPVCGEVKTWMPLTSDTVASRQLQLQNDDHYYLAAEKVTSGLAITDSIESIIRSPGSGSRACLHLNGKSLIATGTAVVFGNSGTLNIVGNGSVSGNRNRSYQGNAIYINNGGGGVINLYGGVYTNGTSNPKGAAIAIGGAGGTINVYEGATIQASGTKNSMCFGLASGSRPSKISVQGGKVLGGRVTSRGATTNDNFLELIDAQVTSDVILLTNDSVMVKGETVISNMTIPEDGKLTVDQMAPGSSVVITAQGVFTEETKYAQRNKDYFIPVNTYYRVTVRDGVLHCGKDFTSSAPIAEGYCPVCEKSVTWQELTAANQGALNGHWYLSDDVTYTGTETAFISGPGSSQVGCLHLNGKKLTATSTIAIYSGSGPINVMGKGTVAGHTNGNGYGAAVQSNSSAVNTGINLYAGTYMQTSNTSADAFTVSVRSAGGKIRIYEDVEILSNKSGKAIRLADSGDEDIISVGLYGAKVTGRVYLQGHISNAKNSVLTVDNANIAGDVLVNGINTVNLVHAPKITYMQVAKQTALTLDRMQSGADITVRADGRFTQNNTAAAEYAEYFTPVNKAATVTAVDGVLTYKTDYNKKLSFQNGNVAYCPVCEKDTTWTELKAEDANGAMKTLENGSHYYLAEPQTFTSSDTTASYAFIKAPGTDQVACLHLNGNDLSATNCQAIYGSNGVLNVMGNGTVAGKASGSYYGAAVQTNNKIAGNAINLYGGTYAKYSGTTSNSVVVAVRQRGTINIYEGATVNGGSGRALYLGTAGTFNAELNLYGCTVTGNVYSLGAQDTNYDSVLYARDATIHGSVSISGDTIATFEGKTVIDKLYVAAGNLVDFVDMLPGSSVKVSATGAFTPVIGEADHYLQYFSTDDADSWIVCRDYQLAQLQPTAELPATQDDIANLESAYNGRTPYHGDLHNHAATGGRSDGKNTLAQWLTLMEERRIDFATIVDHRQSIHMYLDEWDDACFIGGSEPAVPTLMESKAEQATLHYNMIFADAVKFEQHLKNISAFGYSPATDGRGGFYNYVSFSVSEMKEMVKSVLDHGGFFTHVHPKFDDYLISDDPEDYLFLDGTGIEVATFNGGTTNMGNKDNVEAYELWVDLLERDHRVFATIGDDSHYVSVVEALSTIYSHEKTPQTLLDYMRAGDFTAGPVGIRMNIGQVTTGGITSFENSRLVLSAGDIHEQVYNPDHKYGIELYDDGGLIFSTEIDPTETTYFAMDVDSSRKYYRAVITDLTDGIRIAVGNPIWNEAMFAE